MTDPISLLRDADPATRVPDADLPPPRDVLERIVASPAPARRKRRTPRRFALVAVAGAAALGLALALAPGDRPDLAARAYAATSPGDGILYTEVSVVGVLPGQPVERSITQIWQRGDRAHRIRRIVDARGRTRTVPRLGRPWVYEYVQAGGVEHALMPEGEIQTLRPSDGPEARAILAQERTSFVENFRARYADAELHEAGATMFAGRPAVAYVVERRGPSLAREVYYLDADTGMPLGSVNTFPFRRTGRGRWEQARYTETVRRLDRLPPTPENLARLEAPWSRR